MKRKTFSVDFTIKQNGVDARQRRLINESQLANAGNSEFAVQQFLQSQYPNFKVEINRMDEVE